MDELKIETWYKIPTFNGYEIQFTNQQRNIHSYPVHLHNKYHVFFWLRSWKNFKKYPEGYILPYIHGKDYYYELTDISNNRKRLSVGTIVKLIQNTPMDTRTDTYIRNIGSRNNVVYRSDKHNIGLGDLLKKNSLIQSDEEK